MPNKEEATKQAPKGHNPSQHDGGVGNLQNEPKTAEDAKKRAAEKAKDRK